MRNFLWYALYTTAEHVEVALSAVAEWAWGRYWYGPKGKGQEKHSALKSVAPMTFRDHWSTRWRDQ